ncbi:MAG: hypothetical protein AVDCRST_MAG73-3504 [uncultured Thermomicrobiales bacterium]|uniref:Uncharacterized protein n=1 Tax=uncultured Thermomicrobiales bacterium TaxID=1645740 RepID=A0A6J4UST4_9BACT|nr:MAG: hypothetical protein AVDCRST_MAG73-3504 [uncultured Thermomicrobiales bacterium]
MALLAVTLGMGLAACGDDEDQDEDENSTVNESTAVVQAIFDASPVAGTPGRSNLPLDAEGETVAIEDGQLEPGDLKGRAGEPFVLIVTGDGTAHTLAIEGLVTDTPIAPQGETQVSMSVPEGESGIKTITLDGEEAGTFEVQSVAGGTDS